jgi:hypothetical protein
MISPKSSLGIRVIVNSSLALFHAVNAVNKVNTFQNLCVRRRRIGPIGTEQLRLHQNRPDGFFLQVRWIFAGSADR